MFNSVKSRVVGRQSLALGMGITFGKPAAKRLQNLGRNNHPQSQLFTRSDFIPVLSEVLPALLPWFYTAKTLAILPSKSYFEHVGRVFHNDNHYLYLLLIKY